MKMLMEQYGKKRIQKKLPKVLSFQQLLHIYSKGTACVNRYIVPFFYALYDTHYPSFPTLS